MLAVQGVCPDQQLASRPGSARSLGLQRVRLSAAWGLAQALHALCTLTGRDVRACLNTLQLLARRHGRVREHHVEGSAPGAQGRHRLRLCRLAGPADRRCEPWPPSQQPDPTSGASPAGCRAEGLAPAAAAWHGEARGQPRPCVRRLSALLTGAVSLGLPHSALASPAEPGRCSNWPGARVGPLSWRDSSKEGRDP